ncbi:hypothetical protein EGW08_013662 [Elysia chlorotica]|uniref:Uncharacterized protein n=1 Tax=Elysia chlorotica TaxID=188477 RepID=A0A3S0ZMR4_ELYCH|nr:hypothetical protein EGW08_013662 [Elysia chlorotica]
MDSSELYIAINNLDVDQVKRLLKSGSATYINKSSSERDPPIIDCLTSLPLLDTTEEDDEKNTKCDEDKVYEILNVLVQHGADINARSHLSWPEGGTPLCFAAAHRDSRCLQFLLESGADLSITSDEGYTPLMVALDNRSFECVTLLLEKGDGINAVTKNGNTLLSFASLSFVYNVSNICKILHLGLDPTMSRRDQNCIHSAVSDGHVAVIRALVNKGFPALDLHYEEWYDDYEDLYSNIFYRLRHLRISPLAVAIINASPNVAKYFISIRFFTRFDIVRLCWDPEISRHVLDLSKKGCTAATQCLDILRYLSTTPQSLRTLCLVAISCTLSKDLMLDDSDTSGNEENRLCKPTFKEKVASLELPNLLKRALLHQTPASGCCICSWRYLPIQEGGTSVECHCKYCEGEDYEDEYEI